MFIWLYVPCSIEQPAYLYCSYPYLFATLIIHEPKKIFGQNKIHITYSRKILNKVHLDFLNFKP